MLIVPASNVSVPLTVVMLIRSKTPPNVRFPPLIKVPAMDNPNVPELTQVFPDMFAIVIIPLFKYVGASPAVIKNPFVADADVAVVATTIVAALEYPVVTIEPEPI